MNKKIFLCLATLGLLASCGINHPSNDVSTSSNNNVNSTSTSSSNKQDTTSENTKPSERSDIASLFDSISTNTETSISEPTIVVPDTPSADPSYDATKNIVIDVSTATTTNNNGMVVVSEKSIYIMGAGVYYLTGTTDEYNVIVSAGDTEKVELDLDNVSISSNSQTPILVLQADKCEISAKSGTTNTITDSRIVDDEREYNAAIYSCVDLEMKGKGTLTVNSINNNGIHTKDDLDIKNLTLNVKALNNALKGNDSITVLSGKLSVVSTQGDGLKTTNSSISEKGKQKGIVSLQGGTIDIYAQCDAIDSSYNIEILEGVKLNAYTDKYSEFSEGAKPSTGDDSTSSVFYVCPSASNSLYTYKVIFYLEDNTSKEVTMTKVATSGNTRSTYFETPLISGAIAVQVYAYNGATEIFHTERQNLNPSANCLNVTYRNNSTSTSWQNYDPNAQSYQPGGPGGWGGPGGFDEGNTDKADYSCKGLKADNLIQIDGGDIFIKSYDDAIHTNSDVTLENGETPKGDVIINGGNLTLYSNDDGIHADYHLTINGGNINVTNSYEAIEGNVITFNGGVTKIKSTDDGINATKNAENALLNITGGIIYLNANGDGLDSNGNVTMSGGYVVATGPTNGGNGVLDFDGTFKATGGYLLAIGCSGMNQQASCSGNAKGGTKSISTSTSSYVYLVVDSTTKLGIKVTKSSQNYCAYVYEGTSASVNVTTSADVDFAGEEYYVAL